MYIWKNRYNYAIYWNMFLFLSSDDDDDIYI